MNARHAFRYRGPVDQFLNLMVAAAATGILIVFGQAIGYRLLNINGAVDPIAATESYGVLIMWVINPAAALVAGGILRATGWQGRAALIGVLCALVPLWISWLPIAEFNAVSMVQAVLYLVSAFAPFVTPQVRAGMNAGN